MLISTKHRQIQFNIFHRTYYTPYRLHRIDSNISSRCQRCKVTDGDLIHMLWSCPKIEGFSKRAIELTSRVIGIRIEQDPKLWILGDTSSVKVNYYKKYFILLASTAAKKCILINWKSENSPTVRHWINELVSYCTPEKILYNVRGKHAAFGKIWGPFLDVLPSLNLVDCGDVNLPGPS